MPSDEWDEKALAALRHLGPFTPLRTDATAVAKLAREAYQRGRNEADTAAERRGIERAAKKLVLLQAVADAAESVVEAIAERHDTKKPPLKYTVPWGAVSTLMAKLAALATPMADAGPTEPAGASDREGT